MPESREARRRNPWSFVPSQYVLQGIPYFVVQAATNTFFSVLKFPPSEVGRISSDLTLPWMFKALWSPLVDLFGSKRGWILGSAVAATCAMVALAFACRAEDVVASVSIACLLLAIASATNDVATDGFYIHALQKHEQEAFVGVRSASFRLGRVAVMGGAVSLAGWLAESRGFTDRMAYAYAFGACASIYAAGTLWHAITLPHPATDGPAGRARDDARVGANGLDSLGQALREYFARPGVVGAIAFILLYRLAESLLSPMISPFLLAARTDGGLGIDKQWVGVAYGTVGVVALLAGGVLGGFVVARVGLKRCLWPMAIAMHAPNVLYAWAATAQPGLGLTTVVVGVEQFGYGLGLSAYLAVLLAWSRDSRFSTTHYAFSTGIMALSAWLAGRYSGVLVEAWGYERFFWVVSALGVVGLATLPFAPTGTTPEGGSDARSGKAAAAADRIDPDPTTSSRDPSGTDRPRGG